MPYAGFLDDAVVLTKPGVDDVRRLAENKPRAVTIFECPFDSLQPLAVLAGVETLKIQSPGALRTLDGAAALTTVKNLVISTPPTWDGTVRRIEVDSFAPLATLKSLERLILQGVRPKDLDLSAIARMTYLKEVDVGGVPEFTIEHYARLAAALPNAEGRCLKPYIVIAGVGFCKKCHAQQVLLNGSPPKARKWLCPKCHEAKIADHVRTSESFKSASS